MNTFKLSAVAFGMSAALFLTGCVAPISGGQTEGQQTVEAQKQVDSERLYAKFLENKPSFEVQKLNIPATDETLEGIAMYAKSSHEALVALDQVTNKHLAGYKAFTAMQALKSENKQAELIAYEKKLDNATKAEIQAYLQGAQKVSEAQVAQREALLQTAVGVFAIVKQRDQILHGTDWMQKISLAAALTDAFDQANYARSCSDYFDKFNAVLINVQRDKGR